MTKQAKHGESGARSSIDIGAVLLRDSHGKEIRLSWDKIGTGGQTRALSAGQYKVVGYRVEKLAQGGSKWMITASSANFGPLNIEPGKITNIRIPASIQQSGKIMKRGANTNVQMGFVYGKGGVTLYKNSERIPMPFRVVDASGKTVGSGNIEYG